MWAKGRAYAPAMKGEKHPAHKLTNAKVKRMRLLHSRDGATGYALAIRFGVSSPVAYKIINRELWKHIT